MDSMCCAKREPGGSMDSEGKEFTPEI